VSAGTIFLWEAGLHSGAAATRAGALEVAAERLAAGDAEALVEEAELVMTAGDAGGGLVPEHERTGLAWHGHLQDGEAVWEPATAVTP
jgi:hypothetical protein